MLKFASQILTDDAPLADTARREAKALTPQFSQALHDRVMRALREKSVSVRRVLAPARPFVLRHRWLVPAALAALVALIISPVAIVSDSGQPAKVSISHSEVSVITPAHTDVAVLGIDQTAEQLHAGVTTMVETTMAREQWAGLDVDLRRATHFLVEQVPFRGALQEGTDAGADKAQ